MSKTFFSLPMLAQLRYLSVPFWILHTPTSVQTIRPNNGEHGRIHSRAQKIVGLLQARTWNNQQSHNPVRRSRQTAQWSYWNLLPHGVVRMSSLSAAATDADDDKDDDVMVGVKGRPCRYQRYAGSGNPVMSQRSLTVSRSCRLRLRISASSWTYPIT